MLNHTILVGEVLSFSLRVKGCGWELIKLQTIL
jgi:hypothetical protein